MVVKSKSDLPLISVIVTVLNEERGIEESIKSILSQSYENVELVVVDGGSTDDTLLILNNYSVEVIRVPNTTPGEARNIGVKKANGEIVAFTDGDCVPDRGWLEHSLKYFRDAKVGGVGGPVESYDGGSRFSKLILDSISTFFGNGGSQNFARRREVVRVDNLPSLNAIYRKDVFEEAGLFPDGIKYCEDLAINTRIIEKGYYLLSCPDVSVHHNWKVASVSGLIRFMYGYGAGRQEAVKLKLVAPRTPLLLVYPLVLTVIISSLFSMLAQQLFLLILIAYLALTMVNAAYLSVVNGEPILLVLSPLVVLITHLSYTLGYFVEFFKWGRS